MIQNGSSDQIKSIFEGLLNTTNVGLSTIQNFQGRSVTKNSKRRWDLKWNLEINHFFNKSRLRGAAKAYQPTVYIAKENIGPNSLELMWADHAPIAYGDVSEMMQHYRIADQPVIDQSAFDKSTKKKQNISTIFAALKKCTKKQTTLLVSKILFKGDRNTVQLKAS